MRPNTAADGDLKVSTAAFTEAKAAHELPKGATRKRPGKKGKGGQGELEALLEAQCVEVQGLRSKWVAAWLVGEGRKHGGSADGVPVLPIGAVSLLTSG